MVLNRSQDATPVWVTDETGAPLGTASNPLVTSGGGGGGGGGVVTQPTASQLNAQVVGNVASGATDAGNPVKIGGLVNNAVPTAGTAGQRMDAWYSVNGAQVVSGVSVTGGDAINNGNLQMFANSSGTATTMRPSGVANYNFNGTTWDRARGDTNGAYSVSKGSGSIATAQVSVGTTSTQIVAARAGRGSVKITNLGTTDVYIGNTGVTTTTGDLLPGTKGASITVPANVAVFGVAATAQAVSVMEVF